jgi:hypothetical protein
MCPHCRKNAPLVYRGMVAHCAACGHVRPPLTGQAVALAGQPSKVGGTVANVLGYLVLTGGLSLALLLGLLFQWIFPAGIVGFAIGVPLAIFSLAISIPLMLAGKKLRASGAKAARDAEMKAVTALAANRGGVLAAGDVAAALSMTHDAAETLMTDLAKAYPSDITVDLTEQGTLAYRFPAAYMASQEVSSDQARIADEFSADLRDEGLEPRESTAAKARRSVGST